MRHGIPPTNNVTERLKQLIDIKRSNMTVLLHEQSGLQVEPLRSGLTVLLENPGR